MSSGRKWGITGPLLVSSVVVLLTVLLSPSPVVRTGIVVGLAIALGQSFLSTASLLWAWHKPYFYWIWGAGILFRLVVFAVTAFVVHFHTKLNLVATLLSMVVATTLFLVVESMAFLNKKNGFSSST